LGRSAVRRARGRRRRRVAGAGGWRAERARIASGTAPRRRRRRGGNRRLGPRRRHRRRVLRGPGGAHPVVPRARVLPHRLVDQIVDRALELGAHLLEDLPEIIAALELPESLLVLIVVHALVGAPLRPRPTPRRSLAPAAGLPPAALAPARVVRGPPAPPPRRPSQPCSGRSSSDPPSPRHRSRAP